ncbi:hypothetical protein ACG94X_06650 [Acinetobacter sp. ULE_I010]|uniref:hypothetical protein n=1 Tax=Acinetobacter sp. ULE_I010 TaxID=3373065 RepID=UPI003AF4E90A
MNINEYNLNKDIYFQIISRYLDKLSLESKNHVIHYFNVAEIEMSYESFLLSLKSEDIELNDKDANKLIELGMYLGLDQDSVFKDDFWEYILPWLKQVTNESE